MSNAPTALILSTSVRPSQPYSQMAHDLHTALTRLGVDAVFTTLDAVDETRRYDLSLMLYASTLPKHFIPKAQRNAMQERLRRLVNASGQSWSVLMESTSFSDYPNLTQYAAQMGFDGVLDIGWVSQAERHNAVSSVPYRFMYASLPEAERDALRSRDHNAEPVLPWSFIGLQTERRIQLVRYLVENYHAGGFVCLIPVRFWRQGMFLNVHDSLRVQGQSRYSVWCSGDLRPTYIEPQRLTNAARSGAIPVKAVKRPVEAQPDMPFSYLMLDEGCFADQLRDLNPAETWQRFKTDLLKFPSLEDELSRFLREVKVEAAAR